MLAVIALIGITATSCKKDDKKVESNGLTKDINDLVPESVLKQIDSLGMVIHKGGNPPTITGTYFASPFVLKNSNISYDQIGYTFADYSVTFYDQDNENLEVKVNYVNGPETGNGIGGFIVGEDDEFTVFAEMNAAANGDSATMVHVISGKMVQEGIKDLYFANFMIDNRGNPNGYWIENGQGRIVYDSDGMSEKSGGKKMDPAREGIGISSKVLK